MEQNNNLNPSSLGESARTELDALTSINEVQTQPESIEERTIPSSIGSSASLSEPVIDDEMLGTIYVGKYELVSIIGSGGMGVIYQGRQVFLDRTVAIKMLKSNLGGEKARLRFHQEAKASSQLNHPGIIGIIDFGVDEQDRPYMVLEYVEGCTFSDLLRDRLVLSLEEGLPIFLEICDALSIAHHRGVIHRDLKPSNIMLVVGEDAKVHIKLLDFGIAKLLDIQEKTIQSLTKTGEALGTPLYMSPEQILGQKITYRSDLYSLGCMMYACFTGVPPFVGQNKLATMEKHCSSDPLPIGHSGRSYPPALEAMIFKLLAKKPEERFNSVDDVRDALIEIGIQNKLLPRQPLSSAGVGQLYKTGVIPEMPESIAKLVPYSEVARGDEQKVNDNSRGPRDHTNIQGFVQAPGMRRILTAGVFVCLVLAIVVITIAVRSRSLSYEKIPSSDSRIPVAFSRPSERGAQSRSIPEPSVEKESAARIIEEHLRNGGLDSSLSLRGNVGLTRRDLGELLKFKLLHNLDLGETKLTDEGVSVISRLPLRTLNLDENERVSDWSLFNLRKIPKLETLSVARTGITNAGLRYLAHCTNLLNLAVGGNEQLDKTGIINLEPKSSHLQSIYLNGCDFTDDVVDELIKFKNLRSLNLARNPRITGEALAKLRMGPQNYEYLSFSDDYISDSALTVLVKMKALSVLDISGVKLTKVGVKVLTQLQSLRLLYVVDCGLSAEDLQYLELKLPNTAIETSKRCEYRLKI